MPTAEPERHGGAVVVPGQIFAVPGVIVYSEGSALIVTTVVLAQSVALN